MGVVAVDPAPDTTAAGASISAMGPTAVADVYESFKDTYKRMMQRKKQGSFNGPTEEEKEVLKSMWEIYECNSVNGESKLGKINKDQLLVMLNGIGQPPKNVADMDATFSQ